MKDITIYSATIEHKYGTNVYYAKSEKGIEEQLYEYVKEYWESDKEIPKNKALAIDAYFEYQEGWESVEYLEPIVLSKIHD